MPISYEIDGASGMIVTRMEGDLTVADIREYRSRLRDDPGYTARLNQLVDARGVETVLSPADIRRLADVLRMEDEAGTPTRCAVLVDDPAQLGLLEVFRAYSRGRPTEYRAFQSRPEAEAWLRGALRAPPSRARSSPRTREGTMAQENRPNQVEENREQHSGGYGDDTGSAEELRAAETHGDSAVGRENPSANPTDADEALGNRVGGYGRGPEETEGTGLPDGD